MEESTHTTLFNTAIFPFIIPFKLLVKTSVQKFVLKPKAMAEMELPIQP